MADRRTLAAAEAIWETWRTSPLAPQTFAKDTTWADLCRWSETSPTAASVRDLAIAEAVAALSAAKKVDDDHG